MKRTGRNCQPWQDNTSVLKKSVVQYKAIPMKAEGEGYFCAVSENIYLYLNPPMTIYGVTYPVVLIESEGEFAVGCPSLPGCWSQGKTREEALANIRKAIALWLDVEEEDIRQELETSGVLYSRESVTV